MRSRAHRTKVRPFGPFSRGRRGAALVELALTLPILLALATVSLDWGWYLSRQIQLASSVRDAGLAAGGHSMGLDPEHFAIDRLTASLQQSGFDLAGATMTAQITPNPGGDGDIVTLRVTLQWDPLSGLVPMPDTIGAHTAYPIINR